MVRKFHYLGKEKKMTNDHLLWEEEYYFSMNGFHKNRYMSEVAAIFYEPPKL